MPHLIVVLPNLLPQWQAESRRFLKWGSFDLLPYTGNFKTATRKAVWDELNSRERDRGRRGHTILLAAYTVGDLLIMMTRILTDA